MTYSGERAIFGTVVDSFITFPDRHVRMERGVLLPAAGPWVETSWGGAQAHARGWLLPSSPSSLSSPP